MRRRAVAIALASLTLSIVPIAASHAAPSHGGPRLCTWGGTPANPTGIVTFDPGITDTPSAGPIATHAWGPLEGPGCHGTMDFDGIGRPGASCPLGVIFEGPVHGVPGVTRLFGPGFGPLVHEFLYDRQGNIVGSDQPMVKIFGNSAPNSNALDCGTPEGIRSFPFSSTVELDT